MSPSGVDAVDCVISALSHTSLYSVTGVDLSSVDCHTRHCIVSQELIVSSVDCHTRHCIVSQKLIVSSVHCHTDHCIVSQELIVSSVDCHMSQTHGVSTVTV